MITNDQELAAAKERVQYFRAQIEKLRQVESNPQNYRQSAEGFLTEIDRLNLAIREYLSVHPSEFESQAA